MANIVQNELKALLAASVGQAAYTAPTTPIKVRLMTVNGTSTTAGTEVTGGSYASQTVTWNAPTTATPSVITNNGALTYLNMPAVGGSGVVGIEVWDSAATPIRRWFGALTAAKTINAGDTFSIADTALAVSLG
jgi:hypothetical protein